MTKTNPDKRARLLELVGRTKAPTAVPSRETEPLHVDSSDFNVQNNCFWSARWSDSELLLLIIHSSIDPRKVVAAPVTIEPGLQDQESIVIEASANDLGVPVTVWLGLTCEIPLQTLERPLGGLSLDALETVKRGSNSYSSHVAAQVVQQLTSTSAEQRTEMEDVLERWMKDLQPLPSEASVPTSTLLTTCEKPPITLKQVMDALHIPQRKAMNIVRGHYQLTPDEAEKLALYTGIPPENLSSMANAVPRELLLELQQPRWKILVRSEAQRLKTDEIAAQHSVAREALMLAARQSGRDADMWRQRLRTIALGRLSGHTREDR